MDTLLSNQEVPVFFTTFSRPVLVTLSLLEIKGEAEKERKMSNDQDSNIEIYEHSPPQKHAGTPNIPHI